MAVAIDFRDQRVRLVGDIRPRQCARKHAMFRLHAIERGSHPAERLGHCQHAKGVAGRGGIDDDEVKSFVGTKAGDFEQRRDFVDAGQRQTQQLRDVLLIEPRASERNLLERMLARRQPPA